MREIKGDSSRWIKQTFDLPKFARQEGHGAFTVRPLDLEMLAARIGRIRRLLPLVTSRAPSERSIPLIAIRWFRCAPPPARFGLSLRLIFEAELKPLQIRENLQIERPILYFPFSQISVDQIGTHVSVSTIKEPWLLTTFIEIFLRGMSLKSASMGPWLRTINWIKKVCVH